MMSLLGLGMVMRVVMAGLRVMRVRKRGLGRGGRRDGLGLLERRELGRLGGVRDREEGVRRVRGGVGGL